MKAEEYYQSIQAKWEKEYPSMTDIEGAWRFYKECGYTDPQKTLRDILGKASWDKKRVLDFGCDTGFMLRFICDSVPDLRGFGVDINPAAIEVAKKTFAGLDFRAFAGLKLPFEDKYFDLVFISAVIKHVRYEDREQVYQELRRVADQVFFIEVDSQKKEAVPHAGWTFYHSNFKEEFKSQFQPIEVQHIAGDILGLYQC